MSSPAKRGARREPGGSRGSRPDRRGTDAEHSRLSLAVAGASATVVLALLAYLITGALADRAPAVIEARPRPDLASTRSDTYTVPVDVRNVGGATAKEIVIETAIERASGGSQQASVSQSVIDYLAGGETQRIYAIFPGGQRRGSVTSTVKSFQEP